MLEHCADQPRGIAHSGEFVFIFDGTQSLDEVIGSNPPDSAARLSIHGPFLGDGRLGWGISNADRPAAANLADGFGGRSEQTMFCDVHAGGGNLLAGLKGIPAVGQQDTAIGRHQQKRRAAAESRQVEDIGEMGDQERVGAKLGKCKPEPFDPAPV
ncbi:MAG TPA: hypothetical protein VKS44_05155 [Candidatus Acidoferrales bacterium]|nr:hypothetical protein [Candidatus Acidoferrales bacterium]